MKNGFVAGVIVTAEMEEGFHRRNDRTIFRCQYGFDVRLRKREALFEAPLQQIIYYLTVLIFSEACNVKFYRK